MSSRFARNFLQEGPGYDFTREAMQTWERIERGIVSTEDCNKLPGYRRGFWPALLDCLGERPSVRKKDGWFSPPTEHLDYEDRRLVLRFSEAGVLRRSYTLDGRIVQFSIEAVSHLRSVSGTIFQRNGAVYSWRLEPWRPGDANWALFRKSDGALVAAPVAGETSTVAPGEYYLVASDDASVPESLIQEEGPYLDWTDRSGVTPLYRIWTVQLGPGSQWVDFDLRTSGSAVPTLAFEREHGGFVSAGVNVFITQLPSIRVGNWSSEAAQLYAVLVDLGKGPHGVGESIRDGSLHCEIPLPCRGRIWIEPKGRVRHSIASLPNLEFAVLTSQFRWQKPEQMFSDSDQIPVRLESNQKIEVRWVSPVVVVNKKSWRVRPPCRVAEGTLTIDSVEIPFSFRLPRCGVSMPGLRLGPFTLWVDRVDEYRSLLVEALPGREAHLHLKDERDAWKLWTLGIVPESGVRNCQILEFRDSLLSSKVHAAQLGVSVTGGQPVWLDGFVASAKRIREVLSLAAEDCKSFELPLVGPVLREIRTAFDRRIDRLEVPVEVLKSPVGQYIADCALSLAKLDRIKIDCDSSIDSYASPEVLAILLWIEKMQSESVVESQALGADVTFPDLSPLPIKRLRDRLQLQIDKARFWSGLAEEVRNWRQEVLSSSATLVSGIANRKGGKELTRGARLYARAVSTGNQKQFIAVIRELSLLSTSDCDELVGFVGASLHQLAFYLQIVLRMPRRSQFHECRLF